MSLKVPKCSDDNSSEDCRLFFRQTNKLTRLTVEKSLHCVAFKHGPAFGRQEEGEAAQSLEDVRPWGRRDLGFESKSLKLRRFQGIHQSMQRKFSDFRNNFHFQVRVSDAIDFVAKRCDDFAAKILNFWRIEPIQDCCSVHRRIRLLDEQRITNTTT